MKIAIASDHAGYKLKEELKKHLDKIRVSYQDFGTDSEESVDYPNYALKAAEYAAKNNTKGILICGTGIGMSMAANKVRGIRAALCYDAKAAEMARKHNDANILALGARKTEAKTAEKIADIFLSTGFEGGRHKRRVDLISKIEERYMK